MHKHLGVLKILLQNLNIIYRDTCLTETVMAVVLNDNIPLEL